MKKYISLIVYGIIMWGCGDDTQLRAGSSATTSDAYITTQQVPDDVATELIGMAKDAYAEVTDKDGTSVDTIFQDFCEQTRECPFYPSVDACVFETYKTYTGLNSGCKDSMIEMITECGPDPATPCLEPTGPGCKEKITTFQGACMGFKTPGNIAIRWQQVCEVYKMKQPEDCDPSVTMEDVIGLCEFVGASLKDTPECIEKVDLYLECLPQTEYYCPPGQLVPRPNPKTGCYKEADPFTIPTGECINNQTPKEAALVAQLDRASDF